MSLADDFILHWDAEDHEAMAGDVDKVKDLEEEHGQMLELLRQVARGVEGHIVDCGDAYNWVYEYDERNGTAPPPEPPRPVEVAKCQWWCHTIKLPDGALNPCSQACRDAGRAVNPARPEGDKPK